MVELKLTEKEFVIVRLAVANQLDMLSAVDIESLITLIRKFTAVLKEGDERCGAA